MAQSGYTPISIYYSTTASASPTAGNLVNGELAINITDGKLFYKDNAGVVQVIAGKGGAGVAGGSNTQVQYNSSGSLAGSANMTFNGTTLTLANDASISGLTVGKGTGAVSTNTALGVSALNANTSGAYNLAAGYQASYYNTTGSNNVSLGLQAAYNTTTGSNNIAIGVSALNSNTTASSNTAVGYQAGYVSTGDQNTYIGQRAGYTQTSGTLNTYVGYNAANGNSGANSYNTGIGAFCFSNLSTGANNVAIGYQSLQANTTANANVAIGRQAMYSNTTGAENTAVGDVSFYYNTTGGSNVALGRYSLYNNTTANNNTAVGYQAGYTNSTGIQNVYVGYQAGLNATGSGNTFVGTYGSAGPCGGAISTGAKNTILGGYNGNQGGLDIRTSSNYIVLSDGDGNPLAFTANSNTFALQGGTISSGTGIAFPATQSASSNANTLDDYEEGTWTPSFAGSSSSPTVTYVTQQGSYTKIGRQVTVTCLLTISAGSGGSGDFRINGLPFATQNVSGEQFGGSVFSSININNAAGVVIKTSANSTQLIPQTDYSSSGLPVSLLTSGSFNKIWNFTLTYFAAT